METVQKSKPLEKTILIIAVLWLLFGLLYVTGTTIFNASLDNVPGDLFAGLTTVPILITIPLFLLRILLDRTETFKSHLKTWHIIVITIVLGIVVTLAQYGQTYNYFTRANEALDKQYATIDIAYQKRFNIIPNVAKVARSFSEFEQSVVGQITDARKSYVQANSVNDKVKAANQFDGYLTSFVLSVENYPNLKSDALYQNVVKSIVQSEQEIATAKNNYNDQAATFNQNYKTFPYVLVVGFTGYKEREYLKADLGKEIYNTKSLLDNLNK